MRSRWNRVAREHFLFLPDHDDLRMQIFLVLYDDGAHEAGGFVDVALDGHARDHVAELDLTGLVGQNRNVVRIPLHERLAFLHLGAIRLRNDGADDDVVAIEFAAFGVVHADRAVLVQDDPAAVEGLHRPEIVELERAIVLRLDDRLFESLARRAADVERPHRQLGAGFADGLGGDDADRFAEFHELAGRQVASVALRANAAAGFAGEDRANLEALDADLLDGCRRRLIDELVRLDDLLLRHRIRDGFATDAANDTSRKIDHFFVAFVNRFHRDAVPRAAIHLVDDHVLGRVDELAGEVTGIRRLQRGIGQTLAGAVRGNEILKNAQALAEVRGDGPFDDFARGLRHQTAHTGELLHLLAIASRAGVHHQEDRVQFLAALVVFESAEHDVRDFVTGVGPDVDDLVVTLAIRDDALAILLLDGLDRLVSVLQLGLFFLRNDHVGNSDGNSRLGRFRESEFLQAIERFDRAVLSGDLIATPDDVAELLLARGLVEESELHRPDGVEDDTARGRFDHAIGRVSVNGFQADVRVLVANPVVGFHFAVRHGELDFRRVRKQRQPRFRRGTRGAPRILRQVITTERDVLRRRRDRFPARGREDVIRREHEHARFHLRLD